MPNKTTPVSATGKPTITIIGSFQLKTYGSLLKRELTWFETQANNRIKSVLPIYELAKKLATDKDISEEEALYIVKNLSDSANENVLFSYSEDIAAIQASTYSDSTFNADICTMVINSRCSATSLESIAEDLFDYYGVEYNPSDGWTTEDTDNLPTKLIEDICVFTLAEKDRNTTASTPGEVVTLGK